ncbi:meiotically up-regulated gene 113-domain-containing protein [Aspergillus venezuelensis]
MPHSKNTPESGITRSDSKDPATTCRGITASGTPCRRALAASPSPSPNSSPQRKAAGKINDRAKQDITAFYCWQHKDQAETIIRRTTWNSDPAKKQRRSSIDTLMDRLGVIDINSDNNDNTVPEKPPTPLKKKTKKHIFCCFTIYEEDDEPAPLTPRPTPASRPPPPTSRPQHLPGKPTAPNPNPKINSSSKPNKLLPWIPQSLSPHTTSLLLAELAKPISPHDEPGYIYIFWITPSSATEASTTTSRSLFGPDISAPSLPVLDDIASSLLPSPSVRKSKKMNAEPGTGRDRAIDLTADSDSDDPDYASDSESDDTPEQIQRSNTAIRRARDLNRPNNPYTTTRSPSQSTPSTPGTPGTVRLKIGRTSNVSRRLNEWSKQCSNDLTLLRYYPYAPNRGEDGGRAHAKLQPGRKMPAVHRVERLIHLELAEMRITDMGPCADCGKEHKEWFEVGAEREALRRVDACIRRWVRWAHMQK